MLGDRFQLIEAAELEFEASELGILVDIMTDHVVLHIPHLGQPPLAVVGSVGEARYVLQQI